ncbi:MAG: hypothetical protein RL757_1037 [Bacteroidota bacterium]
MWDFYFPSFKNNQKKYQKMSNDIVKKDLSQLDSILQETKQYALDYLENLHHRPTSSTFTLPKSLELPNSGIGTTAALQQFQQYFDAALVASSGPRFWGFVTGGTTPAAIAGDWLTSVFDQNTQQMQGQGDISAVIEQQTMQLLLQLFDLPNDFQGGFVTGATMSNFTCLAVARQWLGRAQGRDIAREGVGGKMTVLTAVPHSSAVKSLAMLGIGSNNFKTIKVLKGNREAIDVVDLERQIQKLRGKPFVLISSGGTVNTVDFDDFEAIAALQKKYQFWWHIDAAFGAFAACSPAYRHLLNGWEQADSITIDGHKWMNVPYESAIYFIKKAHQILQIETFQNANAPYLGNPAENFNYLNRLPENSRRLKALPALLSLWAYGKKGFQEIVENSVACAQYFGQHIQQNPNFQLLAPVRLNTVCFTLAGYENDPKTHVFLKKLNETGKVFMTPTVYDGKKGIRAAFVNWRTTTKDVDFVVELMKNSMRDL